jgi:hypothetical protein
MSDPAQSLAEWAARSAMIKAVVLIGSRARAADDPLWQPETNSDWDFHVITSQPEIFSHAAWTTAAGLGAPLAYVDRLGVLGSARKVSAVFPTMEMDLVVLPAWRLQLAQVAMSFGLHRLSAGLRRALGDLAIVIRPGWRFLHGAAGWEPFYRKVMLEVADPRLDDADAVRLANGFVCDYVWIQRKVTRGEWVAAQRMMHRSLVETNLRLSHELRLRRGERSFPEGRRLERVVTAPELAGLRVSAPLEPAALRAAAGQCAATCRELMSALVDVGWKWPLTGENHE